MSLKPITNQKKKIVIYKLKSIIFIYGVSNTRCCKCRKLEPSPSSILDSRKNSRKWKLRALLNHCLLHATASCAEGGFFKLKRNLNLFLSSFFRNNCHAMLHVALRKKLGRVQKKTNFWFFHVVVENKNHHSLTFSFKKYDIIWQTPLVTTGKKRKFLLL